jgi:hypothetical protein
MHPVAVAGQVQRSSHACRAGTNHHSSGPAAAAAAAAAEGTAGIKQLAAAAEQVMPSRALGYFWKHSNDSR